MTAKMCTVLLRLNKQVSEYKFDPETQVFLFVVDNVTLQTVP